MNAWKAIQDSLNNIEDNLSEDRGIDSLAHIAGLSPFYFQRLFHRLVGKPVNEYIKLRRLAKASEDLKSKDKRIIDVALEWGFSDHANFTRAFKEAYGITPEEYRDCPVILNQFIKPDLSLRFVTVEEDVPLIADGMVIEITRRKLDLPRTFIGIEGEVPVTEIAEGKNTGIATAGLIWNDFHHEKSKIPGLKPRGNEFGVLYMGAAREGCCIYMAGAEITGEIKTESYASYTLPSGEYLVCCFEAENFAQLTGAAIFKASSFMNSWIKKNHIAVGNFIGEMYDHTEPEAGYMELWIPLSSSLKTDNTIKKWDRANAIQNPSPETICNYVDSPLFDHLCQHIETEYQSKPVLEYSKCSMQYGWNMKYKKAGRTLCTLYPSTGYFTALIVIGDRERMETELMLPFFTDYVQKVYDETKTGMGQKWLMIEVTNEKVLEDVKYLIAIRRNNKNQIQKVTREE